ncbi:MAG: hypothetical protein CVU57_23620 [Deltaproteobacteria bacterium HGW-Deltaproteobacteria-15]|nr:MAG: hypothetical protein CVU57_23620 [Deltaproteobacteria bacterium HGW-Deltaproteobacteria-15]
MDIENEPLRSVLERISESADHEITVSENWADMELSIRLDSVNLEKALKQIIVALGKPSHVILTDNKKRKTEILICAEGPGRIENGKDARVKHSRKETTFEEVEVVPPEEPGQRGMTESELNRLVEKSKQMDLRNEEVIPPDEPGGKGMTERELELLVKQNEVDLRNEEVIPPDEPGGKGMTEMELELLLKQSGRVNAQNAEEMFPDEPVREEEVPGTAPKALEAKQDH